MYTKAQYVDDNNTDIVYASAVAVDTNNNFSPSAPVVMGEITTSQNSSGCIAHYVAPPPTPMESVPILHPPVLSPLMPGSLRRIIEIFENERYSPLSGFSSKGLLAMDRGGISDADGNTSFDSLEQASQQLLSSGWSFISTDWHVTNVSNNNTSLSSELPYIAVQKGEYGKEVGWLYNTDFTAYNTQPGHVKKGVTHFVRRRRLTREVVFDEHKVSRNIPYDCDNCDSQCLDALAPVLLEHLYIALRAHYGINKDIPIHKVTKLKNLLIEALFELRQNTYSYDLIIQQLQEFIKNHAIKVRFNALSSIPKFNDNTPEGRHFIQLFDLTERNGIIRSLIRKNDLAYQYHCNEAECGRNCIFAICVCPNPGCTAQFSRKYWSQHDAECGYKKIMCPQLCGCTVVRNRCEVHMTTECNMRVVSCPYQRVGCAPPGLLYRDINAHCDVNTAYHLTLSTSHIDSLTNNVQQLEREKIAQQQTIARLQLQVANPSRPFSH